VGWYNPFCNADGYYHLQQHRLRIMKTYRHSLYRTILLVGLALLLSLSCSISSRPAQPPPAPSLIQQPRSTRELPTSHPKPTQPDITLQDALQVDYIYTSNLITIIYPLYGSILDDFAIITITNTRSTPAQVLVKSEITGYTTQAIDTVTVGAGKSIMPARSSKMPSPTWMLKKPPMVG